MEPTKPNRRSKRLVGENYRIDDLRGFPERVWLLQKNRQYLLSTFQPHPSLELGNVARALAVFSSPEYAESYMDKVGAGIAIDKEAPTDEELIGFIPIAYNFREVIRVAQNCQSCSGIALLDKAPEILAFYRI